MSEKVYYVYLLASRSRALYTGVSSRLLERVKEHREERGEGFTGQYRVQRRVHYETYRDARAAIAREKQIKSWTRAKKVALIESRNPRWEDLAEEYLGRPGRMGEG